MYKYSTIGRNTGLFACLPSCLPYAHSCRLPNISLLTAHLQGLQRVQKVIYRCRVVSWNIFDCWCIFACSPGWRIFDCSPGCLYSGLDWQFVSQCHSQVLQRRQVTDHPLHVQPEAYAAELTVVDDMINARVVILCKDIDREEVLNGLGDANAEQLLARNRNVPNS